MQNHYYVVYCQFGCGILKIVGPKMQGFCPRIDMLKENGFKKILRWSMVHQKGPKLYFQSQFSIPKINRIFSKKKIIKRPFFVKKYFFSNFNFWTTLFSKIMPYFWRIGAPRILKIQWFPLSILIFGQKSYFLGPTILKIPQLNWF